MCRMYHEEGSMRAIEIIIRIFAGIVLAVSIAAVALTAMLKSQRELGHGTGGTGGRPDTT